MLVLSRNPLEVVIVGDDTVVRVLEITDDEAVIEIPGRNPSIERIKLDTSISIADGVIMTLVRLGRYSVGLGFSAPRVIQIDREEVFLSKRAKSTDASLVAECV